MVEERKHGTCRNCKADFERLEKHQHFCCIECRAVSKRESRERFKTTDAYKSSRRASKKKSKTLRRVRQAIRAESIDPIKVFDRDGWRCHMCKQKTPKHLRGTYEDLAPELDHIITLADGGSHTWDNVACSCRQCNIRKGSKSFGQLRIAA
jgi:5-methylcytosine-specific restriction endonuclease McrA